MTTITKELTIAMGHSVTNHGSVCKGIHGHDYRIIATVAGELCAEAGNPMEGMIIDFGDLKQAMLDVIDKEYDHGFVLFRVDPRAALLQQANDMWCYEKNRFHLVDFIPTAENLAKHWFNLLRTELAMKYNIALQQLEVFETPTSSAIYKEPNCACK